MTPSFATVVVVMGLLYASIKGFAAQEEDRIAEIYNEISDEPVPLRQILNYGLVNHEKKGVSEDSSNTVIIINGDNDSFNDSLIFSQDESSGNVTEQGVKTIPTTTLTTDSDDSWDILNFFLDESWAILSFLAIMTIVVLPSIIISLPILDTLVYLFFAFVFFGFDIFDFLISSVAFPLALLSTGFNLLSSAGSFLTADIVPLLGRIEHENVTDILKESPVINNFNNSVPRYF